MRSLSLPRWRRTSSAGLLAMILVVVALVDLAVAGTAYVVRRDEPRPLPSFRLGAPPQAGISATDIPVPTQLPTADLVQTFAPASRTRPSTVPEADGLAALRAARAYAGSGKQTDLESARRALESLLGNASDGLVTHNLPARSLRGELLAETWHSSDAQSLALSAAVSLAETTGEARWARVSRDLFASLLRFRDFARFGRPSPGDPWVSWVDDSGYLWFEQFPGQIEPSRSLTAHLNAVFSVYEYWQLTHDPAAERVFRGGVATVRHYLVDTRNPGSIADNGIRGGVRDVVQHRLLVRQLSVLARMTADGTFSTWSDILERDLERPRLDFFETASARPRGDVDAYSPLPDVYDFPDRLPEAPRDAVPVDTLATFALVALDRHARGEGGVWLRRAEKAVQALLDESVGGMFLHRDRVDGLMGQMTPPWCSAETQGFVLSALVRLAQVTGSKDWRQAADDTFLTFLRFRGDSLTERAGTIDPWTSIIDDNGYVWFERNAQGTATLYIEAQLHATFAVYDYWRLTGSTAAARFFRGSVATIERSLPEIRVPGGVSRLAMSTELQDLEQHDRVVRQLDLFAEMSGEPELARAARNLGADA